METQKGTYPMEKYTPSFSRLKRIAQKHPNFLAYLLSIYQEQNALSDEQLAAFLGRSLRHYQARK